MAKLTAAARQKIPSSKFGLPGKGTGKGGKGPGSYPMPDRSHAANALSRVSAHGSPEEKAKVRAKAHRLYPDIGKKQAGGSVPNLSAGLIGRPKMPRPSRSPFGAGIPTGRVGRSAGMHKGGMVPSPKKPHTYHGGGVATCGNLKDHGGFAALGIKKG